MEPTIGSVGNTVMIKQTRDGFLVTELLRGKSVSKRIHGAGARCLRYT